MPTTRNRRRWWMVSGFVLGAVLAWLFVDLVDRDRVPQAASVLEPQCASQVRQEIDNDRDGRFSAEVTKPDCTVETVRGALGELTSVEVWPTKTGQKVLLIEGGDGASTLKIRHLGTGRTLTVFEAAARVREARLSPDGSTIALEISGEPDDGYGHVQLVDIKTGTVTRLPETVHSARPHWSPDGSEVRYLTAASADDPTTPTATSYHLQSQTSEVLSDVPDDLLSTTPIRQNPGVWVRTW